jgi:hypothetical protein
VIGICATGHMYFPVHVAELYAFLSPVHLLSITFDVFRVLLVVMLHDLFAVV